VFPDLGDKREPCTFSEDTSRLGSIDRLSFADQIVNAHRPHRHRKPQLVSQRNDLAFRSSEAPVLIVSSNLVEGLLLGSPGGRRGAQEEVAYVRGIVR